MIERITRLEKNEEDTLEIRPKSIHEFIGQQQLKENMMVYIQAALKRRDVIDHVLLSGPPGLGKTTFSMIIAKEMKSNFKSTIAPVIEKIGDMAAILSALKANETLFIDEIHRLKPVVEEILYSAMEDGYLDLNLGQGASSKTVKIKLPPFTLVGATTKPGALTQPLISRFGIVERFNFYQVEDLEQIAAVNARKMKIEVSSDGISEIAKRSRGTPRILNRLLKRVRDFAEVRKEAGSRVPIDQEVAAYALGQMKIDQIGLAEMDRNILNNIITLFSGGPVGVDNLASSLGEDAGTIEDIYEPFLIQKGLIQRTHRGRVATSKAFQYLGLDPASNEDGEPNLFSPNS